MFCLWKHLCNVCPEIKILDVGAMYVGDKNLYDKISGISKVIGFEPGKEECEKLNYESGNKNIYLPYFIGDGSVGIFRKCNQNMTSSFYEPNMELLEKFQLLAELTQVIDETQVATFRLDDLEEIADADYLKIDVQGNEVDVFSGADKLLDDILVVHTEVCFVPLYKKQPLFAEIDQSLRKKGFLFHRFAGMCGRAFKPMFIKDKPTKSLGQMMWADAVYVKDFMQFDLLSSDKLLKLAVILHDIYGSYDMANLALESYDKKNGSTFADYYKNTIRSKDD